MMKARNLLNFSVLLLSALLAVPAQPQDLARQRLSDELIRAGISYLDMAPVTESDAPIVLTSALLDTALQLNPVNDQAWGLRIELAKQSGDMEAYEKALSGYLDTGVQDDPARFNLITHRLSHRNTLDAQFNAVEQLLNSEAGRALSQPLRSRLASMAAESAGELFEPQAQRTWAVEAARADTTNTVAAVMMRQLVIDLGGDRVRQGTATVNIVRANPLLPRPRLDLAAMLTEEAAFDRAGQQYQVVGSRLSRQPLPLPAYLNWAHCLAITGQDVLALQLIDELEKGFAAIAERAAQQGDTALQPEGDAAPQPEADDTNPNPYPATLPIEFDLVRLSVLDGSDDESAAKAAFAKLEAALSNDEATPERRGQLALIAATFGPDLDQAAQLAEALPADDPRRSVALGWVALRRDESDKARELLAPMAEDDKLASCGMAILGAIDHAGRARALSQVIQQAPSSMAALVAGRRLARDGQQPQPTDTGKVLTDLMGRYPESFWQVDVDRTPWLDVRMKIEPQRINALEPIKAEITIWNTTQFPLAISEEGPIQPRALVLITASSSGNPLPPMSPIVIDLGRRFSLAAKERLIFDVRLDYHQFGAMRSMNPGSAITFDARLLVNPAMTPGGTWLASPTGGVSTVRNCIVQGKPADAADVDRWLEELKGSDTTARLNAMARLVGLSVQTQPELMGPAVRDKVTQALLGAWDEADDVHRAWIIMHARSLGHVETSFPELLPKALESDSGLIWFALLARQVRSSDSPILRDAIARQDMPEVSRFAERQRRLLRDYEAYVEEQKRLQREQEHLQQQGGVPDAVPLPPTQP